jgi:DNA replication ATP-dependent helicase Dna2
MSAQDYAIVQGMPGTGKTHTIAFIARLLAARGMRVLITTYTHNAVDTLMSKLLDAGVGRGDPNVNSHSGHLVRIGQARQCLPQVQEILVSRLALLEEHKETKDPSITDPCSDVIRRVMSKARIVGVSSLTVPKSSLLIGQDFDVVIVDEAGQMTQPACLGPLMAAKRFVLVGDHMQLPPVVKSPEAKRGGKSVGSVHIHVCLYFHIYILTNRIFMFVAVPKLYYQVLTFP